MKEYYEFGNWLVQPVFDWSQIRSGYNWRTFRLIMVEVEDDRMFGAVEATVVLLGFGLRVRWTHTLTDKMEDLLDGMERVKADLEALEKGENHERD